MGLHFLGLAPQAIEFRASGTQQRDFKAYATTHDRLRIGTVPTVTPIVTSERKIVIDRPRPPLGAIPGPI
jgi:hypothetical protein